MVASLRQFAEPSPVCARLGTRPRFDRTLRFDGDGMRYEAPLARTTDFPPLAEDGAEHARQGYRLRRLSIRRYQLFHHGEPAMEFEFHHPEERARLTRLFRGEHEIVFHYTALHQLQRIVDSLGRTIGAVEDESGRLVSLTLEQGLGQGRGCWRMSESVGPRSRSMPRVMAVRHDVPIGCCGDGSKGFLPFPLRPAGAVSKRPVTIICGEDRYHPWPCHQGDTS